MRSEILRLLVNTLTANYEFSRSKREKLELPIQIKLTKKRLTFYDILFAFFVSKLNLQCCEKNIGLIGQAFLKLLTPKYVFI